MKSKLFKNSERRITKAFTKKKVVDFTSWTEIFFYEIILILKSCSHAISLLFLN